MAKKFAELCGAHGRVTCAELARALLKRIVLNRSAQGKMAAQLGDAFSLVHEIDFGEAKLLALG
jgi:hypothetical protein